MLPQSIEFCLVLLAYFNYCKPNDIMITVLLCQLLIEVGVLLW